VPWISPLGLMDLSIDVCWGDTGEAGSLAFTPPGAAPGTFPLVATLPADDRGGDCVAAVGSSKPRIGSPVVE
jgi:hypothetical protein